MARSHIYDRCHCSTRPRAIDRASCAACPPPQLYFVVSAVFHYLGPAFAVLLFARVDVLGVAWLRIASAAVIFARVAAAVARVRRAGPRRPGSLLAWGAVLARR